MEMEIKIRLTLTSSHNWNNVVRCIKKAIERLEKSCYVGIVHSIETEEVKA